MRNSSRTLTLLLLPLFLSSCKIFYPPVPHKRDIKKVIAQRYIRGKNDCSNKAAELTRRLRRKTGKAYQIDSIALWNPGDEEGNVVVRIANKKAKTVVYMDMNKGKISTQKILSYKHQQIIPDSDLFDNENPDFRPAWINYAEDLQTPFFKWFTNIFSTSKIFINN